MSVTMDPAQLLEREQESAVLAEAIAGIGAGQGHMVVVEGEAGIGKSVLLGEAARGASAAGLRVLRARGGELERELTFGVVRQLLEATVARADSAEQAQLLRGAAGAARRLLGLAEPTDPGPADEPTLVHALYWLCTNLAECAPLCLVVDDAQWSDEPSLRWLVYLARRLEELPVALLLAVRTGEPDAPVDLLEALALQPGAERVRLNALSGAATAALVAAAYGSVPDAAFSAAIQQTTGGNPFLTREVLATLVADGVAPASAQVARVTSLQPRAVASSVLLRLGRLSRAAVAVARAVAVLGTRASLAQATELAELDREEAAAAADALAAAHVLRPGRPLEFLHPVIRSVLYQDIPAGERSRSHARAARVLQRSGAQAAEIVVHLLAAEPAGDPEVVELLRRAVATETDPRRAIALLRRALAEPPAQDVRAELLLELGEAEARAYRQEAIEHLSQARELANDRARFLRASRALARAWTLHEQPAAALEWARTELGAFHEIPRAGEERELYLALRALEVIRGAAGSEEAAMLRDEARAAATPGERYLLAALGYKAIAWGRARDGLALGEAALRGGLLNEGVRGSGFMLAICAVQFADAQARALEVARAALHDARSRGDASGYALALTLQADAAVHHGLMTDAGADAEEALRLAGELGLDWAEPVAIATLLEVASEQGRFEQAEALVGERELSEWQQGSARAALYLHARGLLRLAAGRTVEALADFVATGDVVARYEIDHPTIVPWRSNAARALLALDRREEAHEHAERELKIARAFGAPWAIGNALRVLGLVEGGERGLELLHEAVDVLDRSEALLYRARALVDLGAALRRANERAVAREPLRQGLDLAHHCGATLLADRAEQELEASGARPRRRVLSGVEALTPSEKRVAEMAARGLSNRDIAQELFLSIRTIENQLRQVYLKLDVAGRKELPGALAS